MCVSAKRQTTIERTRVYEIVTGKSALDIRCFDVVNTDYDIIYSNAGKRDNRISNEDLIIAAVVTVYGESTPGEMM